MIGATALALRGFVRATADVDLLTADDRVLDERFWSGTSAQVRKGDWDDALAGSVRWLAALEHDVVVSGRYAARVALDTAEMQLEVGCRDSGAPAEALGGRAGRVGADADSAQEVIT